MVQIKVSEGILEGELVENALGGTYYSFKGIPYAEPPVGDLRFKAPVAKKPWEGVLSAKHHGSSCPQLDMFFTKSPMPGSEDCLFLNVYSPDIKPTKPLPVMVWIHGGGFFCGSGDDLMYGPELLVRHDVVLVTINYRLEVFGFLCLDTEDVPGNAGMKDQVLALKWVKENISKFGGDPENVTIFGESAGGASVSYHLMSPMSKGLFKRAIAQSGAATCHWTQSTEPRERALALAKKLGFISGTDKELYEFFKSQPANVLIGAQAPITLKEQIKPSLNFTLVNEKYFGNERFFYGDMNDNVKRNVHQEVDVMTGYVEHEGLVNLGMMDVESTVEKINNFNELLVPAHVSLNCSVKDVLECGRMIKKHYLNNELLTKERVKDLLTFDSMVMFIYDILHWVKLCVSANKNNVYLYKFTCKTKRNIFGKHFGAHKIVGDKPTVSHCDDLPYLFPMNALFKEDIDVNSDTFKHVEKVLTLWTNFAKYGNPTPDNSLGVKWTPFTVEAQDYLEIGIELMPGKMPEKEEMDFYENLYTKFYPYVVAK